MHRLESKTFVIILKRLEVQYKKQRIEKKNSRLVAAVCNGFVNLIIRDYVKDKTPIIRDAGQPGNNMF